MSRPPVAPRRPTSFTRHGIAVADDYAWLKDPDWQKVLRDPSSLQPDIFAYLEAENRYTAEMLAPTEALQKQLVAEMRGRIKEDDSGVPMPDGRFAYSWKYRDGGQHQQIGRLPRNGGDFQSMRDGDALAAEAGLFQVWQPPPLARPSARSLERRPAGLRLLITVRDPALGQRRGSRRPHRAIRRAGLGRRRVAFFFYVGATTTIGPWVYPSSPRHAPSRRRAGLRGAQSAASSHIVESASPAGSSP